MGNDIEWDYGDVIEDQELESDEELQEKPEKVKLMDVRADTGYEHQGNKDHYLITSALNNTPANRDMLETMEVYANYLGAQIIVGTERYHNAYRKDKNAEYEDGIYWDRLLIDYVVDWQIDLFADGHVLFDGHLRQRATILNPLDIYSNTAAESLRILPSAKLHQFSAKRHVSHKEPSYFATTGTITPYKYSDNKTGYRSSQATKLGFLHVYKRNDGYFAFRQVEVAEDGSFYDLDLYVDKDGVWGDGFDAVEAVMLPDSHVESMPDEVWDEQLKMLFEIQPGKILLNDIINWEYNHHKTPMNFYQEPVNDLRSGLHKAENWVFALSKLCDEVIVLDSNHHYHLDQRIEKFLSKGESNTAYWKDLVFLAGLKLENPKLTAVQSFIDLDEEFSTWTSPDEIVEIGGITQFHGHVGTDGARGTRPQFKALATPVNHGHFHSGYRKDDVMGVGVACYNSDQSYANQGFTTWTISAITQYQNGSRQLLHFIAGRWY